jgi:hypothetical protein
MVEAAKSCFVHDLLITYPPEPMRMWPISTRVNAPENDDAALLDRTADPFDMWPPEVETKCDVDMVHIGLTLQSSKESGRPVGGQAPGALALLRREGNPTPYRLSAAL